MRNIKLFCAAGMSTSMLVERMKAAAADQGYEVEIAAHAVAEASKLGGDADFILLGPPVRFEVDRVKALFPDKPVEAIDTVMYGTMYGVGVINHVREVLGD